MSKPRIMYYHDGRHPLIYMYEPPIYKEQYEQVVDELVGTPIDAIMFCLGDGRTVLHDTQVGELWGHNVEKWSHNVFRRAGKNAKHLIEQGHDPLRLVCDRAVEYGIKIYPVLLVNQGSGERHENTRGSDFRLDNKHLDIGARGDLDPDFPGIDCADFKHEEIRRERLDLIKETLNKYPVDGLELQMNYVAYYFHPDEVEDGKSILTKWIRQVYDVLKESGAERELAIRIPANINDCLSVGMDPREWIDQSIVDVLIGSSFGNTARLDPELDFRPLVEAAKGSGCRVHACIESTVDTDRMAEGPIEAIRGAACNYWAQGVDGLYMAQWFIRNWPYDGTFYEKLREIPYPQVMAPKDKTYAIPTLRGGGYDPKESPNVPIQLPVELSENVPVQVKVSISDDLTRWAAQDRVYEVILRVRLTGASEMDRVRFLFNGMDLPKTLLRRINHTYVMKAPRYRVNGYWYIFNLDQAHWPKQGANSLEVTLLKRDQELLAPIGLRDVEIDTRYIKGNAFYRSFDDPDLGPIEASVT
jgi:hypothetical protein